MAVTRLVVLMEVVVGLASNEREADRKRERGREKEEIKILYLQFDRVPSSTSGKF